MTTKQTDTAALTDEQLEGVAGGGAYIKFSSVRGILSDDLTGLDKQGGRFSSEEIKIIVPNFSGR